MAARLAGKTAFITGAASGIAAETARLFAAEGAAVVLGDLDAAGLAMVAGEIEAAGGAALALPFDITNEPAWEQAFAAAAERFGQVDILMNCAGLFLGGPLEKATLADYDRICDVNLKGTFLGCKHAVRHMKARPTDGPAASIINVSSTAGMIGTVDTALYTMTKGGVRLLTKSVAVEVAHYGYNIRCNSLHPGATATAMHDGILALRGLTKEAYAEIAKTRNPLGRMAQPREIADGALFLASDESSFMTGSELALDGGYAAR